MKRNTKDSITFVTSFIPSSVGGGAKVMYIYANYLVSEGWDVHIVHAYPLWKSHLSLGQNIRNFASRLYRTLFNKIPTPRSWYPIDDRIKIHYPINCSYSNIPRTSFYVAVDVSTAAYVKSYKVPDYQKLYLIQGYENWGEWTDQMVRETYHYGFKNIVISKWLKSILDEEGVESILIPNGFDFDYFRMTIPFEKKNKFSCSALYGGERKGVKYAIEACEMVRKTYSQLRLVLYGISPRPDNLPTWVDYFQTPDKETHNKIYNESAIFLGASLQEGWGLPVGESMMCGAAVCCTDTQGYMEMVTHGVNGLICPTANSKALAENIMKLIEDDSLRINIAKKGYESIQQFTWDKSFKLFSEILQS